MFTYHCIVHTVLYLHILNTFSNHTYYNYSLRTEYKNYIYFFFSVKKLLRFGSSLRSPEAGSVWEREGSADP